MVVDEISSVHAARLGSAGNGTKHSMAWLAALPDFLQLPGAAPQTSDHAVAEHQLIDWSKVVRV